MKPQRIAYCGNFGPSHSTENHLKLSLESLGHEVIALQESTADFRAAPDLCKAEGAAFFMWTKTWDPDADAQRDMLAALRAQGTPSVAYHLDRYLGLPREEQVTRLPWFRCDVMFTPERSDRWESLGVNHRWMPPGVYEAEARLQGNHRPRYESDVVFVGSGAGYHPEWTWRQELLAFLHEHYRRRFTVWPRGRAIRGQELSDLYASAKVVVGDSCLLPPTDGYHSDRIPETLGRGGFLLHPWGPGIDDLYVDGEHLRFYPAGDKAALKALIDYYLVHDTERQAIARQGREHVLREFTYTTLMDRMLDTLRTEGLI